MIKKTLLALSVIALASAGALAQQASIKRTPLQTANFPEDYSTGTVSGEVAPGASSGCHTHPARKSASARRRSRLGGRGPGNQASQSRRLLADPSGGAA